MTRAVLWVVIVGPCPCSARHTSWKQCGPALPAHTGSVDSRTPARYLAASLRCPAHCGLQCRVPRHPSGVRVQETSHLERPIVYLELLETTSLMCIYARRRACWRLEEMNTQPRARHGLVQRTLTMHYAYTSLASCVCTRSLLRVAASPAGRDDAHAQGSSCDSAVLSASPPVSL